MIKTVIEDHRTYNFFLVYILFYILLFIKFSFVACIIFSLDQCNKFSTVNKI